MNATQRNILAAAVPLWVALNLIGPIHIGWLFGLWFVSAIFITRSFLTIGFIKIGNRVYGRKDIYENSLEDR